MSDKRSYDDPCGLARALDAVGERWALLVVRELLHGPKRFGDLRRGLRGASQNVLSQRLRDLDAAGVVARRRLGPPASTWVYDLTPRGRDLEPVLFHLSRWGSRAPMTSSADLSVDALMLALKTTFDADRSAGLMLSVELRMDEDRFAALVADRRLALNRVSSAHRDGNGGNGAGGSTITEDADPVDETSAVDRRGEGNAVPGSHHAKDTPADTAEHRADAAQHRADAAQHRADAAEQRADAAQHRADAAEHRADAAEHGVDAVIAADVATLRSLVFGGRDLDDAVHTGSATVIGSHTAAERFFGLFPRPAPAER